MGTVGDVTCPENGGAGRDRTDDLKLAKLPLSQLSYGPFIYDAQTPLRTTGADLQAYA